MAEQAQVAEVTTSATVIVAAEVTSVERALKARVQIAGNVTLTLQPVSG